MQNQREIGLNDSCSMKKAIINYIKKNRVSTTEVADCLGKAGALENVLPINSRHFAVGEIQYLYAIQESNWPIHEELDKFPFTEKIVMIDALDVKDRAIIADIVSKYILLYMGNIAIVSTGKMRDAPFLIKENYPIWCTGVSPVGCFNEPVDIGRFWDKISERKEKYQGAIAVCDDSGVVIIPRDQHTSEFYQKLIAIEHQEDTWYECIDQRKWSTYKTICLKEYLNDK